MKEEDCDYPDDEQFGEWREAMEARGTYTYTANLRTKILDFGGFDSGIILIVKGWNSQAPKEFPGSLTQAILVGKMPIGRLGTRRY